MFEGTLIESRGLIVSKTRKWTTLGSLTLQVAVAAVLLAIPLLRPEALRVMPAPPRVMVPVLSRPPVPVEHLATAVTNTPAVSAPSAPIVEQTRRLVFPKPGGDSESNAPLIATNLPWGSGGTSPLAALTGPGTGTATGPVVLRERTRPVPVSTGVLQGMLLKPIQPVYPAITKAARLQGDVVIDAVISKAGRIEKLQVVSGPEMLRASALDAVSAARYRPYLLNGEPVDVQTEIRVMFRLSS